MGGLVQYSSNGSYIKTHYTTDGLQHNTITVVGLKHRAYIPLSEMFISVSLQFNEPLYT